MRFVEALSKLADAARLRGDPPPTIKLPSLSDLLCLRRLIVSDVGGLVDFQQGLNEPLYWDGLRFVVEKPRVRVKAGRRVVPEKRRRPVQPPLMWRMRRPGEWMT